MKKLIILIVGLIIIQQTQAQILTNEDSLSAGLTRKSAPTVISGYGEAKYSFDKESNTAEVNVTRAVLFIGHRFNEKIQFFSEWELEDAKIAGGSPGGEFALEQLFLKFNINRNVYIQTGLFIPRIGVLNENHLPTTYNGNDRHRVEKYVIPSTWRELGVGLYGQTPNIPGLNYSLALVNGLNAEGFENGTGIREGRYEGKEASGRNLAVTGSLLYYYKGLRIQTSMYYGGTIGMDPKISDTLNIKGGTFGTPVMLNEINAQYKVKGLTLKILACYTKIKDAAKINNVFGNNTPSSIIGTYLEVGYDLMSLTSLKDKKNLTVFTRYEWFDLNYTVPTNGTRFGSNNQTHIISGVTYFPIRGVAIKADWHHKVSGDTNNIFDSNSLITLNNYFNLGIGYSF